MTQIDKYFAVIADLLQNVHISQNEAMMQAALLLADTVQNGSTIFITGCGHSSIFAQEVFYRAGGFMLMNPIFLPGMMVNQFPVTTTSNLERISGIAEAVLAESPIRMGDVLIIASISGRNDVPVELSLWAKERGVKVIALTSLSYSSSVASRHKSGMRLYETADLVLDLMCPAGDAVMEIEGLPIKTTPVSTVSGIVIMHAVISQTIELLVQRGIDPPVFLSGNLDHGDEHNRRLMARYSDRIHYMR